MYFDESSVKQYLSLPSLLEILSDVLHRYSKHDPSLQQPIRSVLPIDDRQNFLLNKPCIDLHRGYMCVKTITYFPASSPTIDGVVSLFDSKTGRLLLTADAKEITAQRTAATSFLATQLLAFSKWTDDKKNHACLTIIGCSVQGHAHLEVFTQLFKWNKVYLWSRNVKNAIDLQSKYASQLKHIEILKDLNDIRLQETDVICTCTGSEQALIGLKQVKKGVHINAVGSFSPKMRELADDLMISEDTNVVVDSRESAMKEAGEIIQSKANIAAEVGELVNNEVLLQEISQQKTTIFKSVGLAIEDLAAAIVLHESKTNA
ncbi:unnamed protein product [Adineta ricciae]|uniref:Ketimine reductase mu-crystallin n=1 Tax=Adineta ricciae TaxID=249248 RepID=A0A813T964_ADIRI|nr:unnamed protein product [Adineta ricciae]CAF0818035.1 unnamed protein product [Adineta ricciae]